MIGYYAHHRGTGHIHRAAAIAAAATTPFVCFSTAPPPADWTGRWITLPDDSGDRSDAPHRLCYDLADRLLAPWPAIENPGWPSHWLATSPPPTSAPPRPPLPTGTGTW